MPKNQNIILHSCGFVWCGDDDLYDVTDFMFVLGLQTIEAALKNSTYVIPVSQPIRARVQAAGMNLNLLSRLTGGSVSAGCTRVSIETIAKLSNALGCDNEILNSNAIRVMPVGANKSPLIQVAGAPAVGQYQLDAVEENQINLHADQPEDNFVVTYLYTDGSSGDVLQIDPDDLPSSFAFFGIIPAEDVFPGTSGYMLTEFAKVQRMGDIELGGGKNAFRPLEFEVNVVNASPGDVKIHLIAE